MGLPEQSAAERPSDSKAAPPSVVKRDSRSVAQTTAGIFWRSESSEWIAAHLDGSGFSGHASPENTSMHPTLAVFGRAVGAADGQKISLQNLVFHLAEPIRAFEHIARTAAIG